MKKFFLIPTAIIAGLLLFGCGLDKIKSDLLGVKDEAEEKIENVKNEYERVKTDIIETKDKIENKYEKGKKVLEAIDEFNKDS